MEKTKGVNGILRDIQVYSNAKDKRLDYKKKYWFHHWIKPDTALIENEEGELMEIHFDGNFRFNK